MKLKFRALNIHREILLSLSMTHSNFTQVFTLLLRHYSYSGLEFNLNISQENLVLERNMITLVIVLPVLHEWEIWQPKRWERGCFDTWESLWFRLRFWQNVQGTFHFVGMVCLMRISLSHRKSPSHRRK